MTRITLKFLHCLLLSVVLGVTFNFTSQVKVDQLFDTTMESEEDLVSASQVEVLEEEYVVNKTQITNHVHSSLRDISYPRHLNLTAQIYQSDFLKPPSL